MSRPARASRSGRAQHPGRHPCSRLAAFALTAGAALLTGVLTAGPVLASAGHSLSSSIQVSHSIDKGLCPFPLSVTVRTKAQADQAATTALQFRFAGTSTITLRNETSGATATLDSSGPYSVDTTTGSIAFSGHHVWLWSTGGLVPFLSTDGPGSLRAPYFTLTGASRAHVIDPCSLLAASPPSTRPVTTAAPWGLPRSALGQIGYARLTPIVGTLVRHDHVHLDVIVNGRAVTIPAGVGQAEPRDNGPCPPGTIKIGDCTSGHFYAALVANSPIHTHSTSGIIHVESDRATRFTLGEFFDEWGVRLDATCVGGYCAGDGRQLRAYVDGKRVAGNPRDIVLTNRQEIALVYGGPAAFGSVPATYKGGWPGLGCGGAAETPCLP